MMKVDKKKLAGFQEIYTHIESLPTHIELPDKKPFIILTLPADSKNMSYLIQNFPLFYKLGYSKTIGTTEILTITSKRKVDLVINAILASPDYNHAKNTELLEHLRIIQKELTNTDIPKKTPPKSKELTDYLLANEPIKREPGAPEPSHNAVKVAKDVNSPIEILKGEESGRTITEIEAFNGLCYRLLLNQQTPKVRSVHENNDRIGVLSRAIDNFQSLHDYYIKQEKKTGVMRSPPQKDLVKAGIGRILAAAYIEEENDLHGGNIGYDPIQIKTYKIDHDQSNWPLTSKYKNIYPDKPYYQLGSRPCGIKPKDAFPITQRDISNFPHLQDAKPRSFPDQTDNGLLDLKGIENDPDFVKDVFSTFIKSALFDENVYRAMTNETIGNPKLRETLIAHKTERSELLKAQLINNEKFLNFLIENPDLKAQIIAELNEYNHDYKNEHNPLCLNLEDLGKKYDTLVQQTFDKFKVPQEAKVLFETYYQPDDDINSYQYKTAPIDAKQRKQTAINKIKSELKVSDNRAEFIFNAAKNEWQSEPQNSLDNIIERKAEHTLNDILQDIINLDSLGALGGENETLNNGKTIKIPRGVAVIFDLQQQYQNKEITSAISALDAIIAQANRANTYKGFTLFNHLPRDEINSFYDNLVSIQYRTVPQKNIGDSLMETMCNFFIKIS